MTSSDHNGGASSLKPLDSAYNCSTQIIIVEDKHKDRFFALCYWNDL